MGTEITFPSNGGTAAGYLATPATGRGPGVIVIQEWWGLNDQIKGVADMLAGRGFNALAPDFYHGKSAKIGEPTEAQKLMMELFQASSAAKDAKGAAAYLAKHPATSSAKVGVIGFCMGGFLALLTGTVAPAEVGVVVDCYGVGQEMPDLRKLKDVAVLGLFGGKDHLVDPTAVTAQLAAAGVRHEITTYPEADHAFMNEQRPSAYRPDDASDAWRRAIQFLSLNLR